MLTAIGGDLNLPLRIVVCFLLPRVMPMMNFEFRVLSFELFSAEACDCELFNVELPRTNLMSKFEGTLFTFGVCLLVLGQGCPPFFRFHSCCV